MKVLGIDPGSARMGYGVVRAEGSRMTYETMGVVEIPPQSAPRRLAVLARELDAIIAAAKPDRIGIERLFFTKNKTTGIAVAEARGVILVTAGGTGVPIVELSPNEIKRAVTGDGNASKTAVAKMVRWILGIKDGPAALDDATDALAIAIAAAKPNGMGVRGG